jgi:RNA polymerase sigma factor (sigma-70 family)
MLAAVHSSDCPAGVPVELLARCEAGDDRAWRRLLADVRELALDMARWRYGLKTDDAEDVAQVVQIRVTERMSQLRDRKAFPAWVRRLVHHAVIDQLRGRKTPPLSLDELTSPDVRVPEPEAPDEYDRILLRTDLDQALARLPERYREPIRLHLLDGLRQDDIGRILGRPRSTVASQIERGLTRLQRSLAGMTL